MFPSRIPSLTWNPGLSERYAWTQQCQLWIFYILAYLCPCEVVVGGAIRVEFCKKWTPVWVDASNIWHFLRSEPESWVSRSEFLCSRYVNFKIPEHLQIFYKLSNACWSHVVFCENRVFKIHHVFHQWPCLFRFIPLQPCWNAWRSPGFSYRG